MTTFEGAQLQSILASQREPVQVCHPKGHVEVQYTRASDAIRLVAQGGYFGVGHRRRIRYIQPYSMEARVEPWCAGFNLSALTGRGFLHASTVRGKGCVGRTCDHETLHVRQKDALGRHGDIVRRI